MPPLQFKSHQLSSNQIQNTTHDRGTRHLTLSLTVNAAQHCCHHEHASHAQSTEVRVPLPRARRAPYLQLQHGANERGSRAGLRTCSTRHTGTPTVNAAIGAGHSRMRPRRSSDSHRDSAGSAPWRTPNAADLVSTCRERTSSRTKKDERMVERRTALVSTYASTQAKGIRAVAVDEAVDRGPLLRQFTGRFCGSGKRRGVAPVARSHGSLATAPVRQASVRQASVERHAGGGKATPARYAADAMPAGVANVTGVHHSATMKDAEGGSGNGIPAMMLHACPGTPPALYTVHAPESVKSLQSTSNVSFRIASLEGREHA